MEDFCDRIPGQHTGRLSLEHQAREADDWQRKVDDLQKQLDSANRIIQIKDETIILHEKRCDNLREELDERADTIAVLHKTILEKNEAIRNMHAMHSGNTQDQSNGVHPMCEAMAYCTCPIIGGTAQAHGLTAPATPSAAVGADGPVDGSSLDRMRLQFLEDESQKDSRMIAELKEQLNILIENKEQMLTELRSENTRLTKLNHHLREAAVMAIVERVPSDSKPTNCHNPESEDTPPHNPVLGPVVGTAKVSLRDWCQKSSGTRFPEPSPPAESPAIRCVPDAMTALGRMTNEQCEALSEQPAESPDDWVMITDPDHIVRDCDLVSADSVLWRKPNDSFGNPIRDYAALQFRCRRKDLPPVPVTPKTRTVTLREYLSLGISHWTTATTMTAQSTGRTAVVEVPE